MVSHPNSIVCVDERLIQLFMSSDHNKETPPPFVMKLRRYIKAKRLEDIRQVGNDRIVDLRFGSGESTNHIILELFANGNLILTNAEYEIMALLRSHQDDEVLVKVGEIYPIAKTCPAISSNDQLVSSVAVGLPAMSVDAFKAWATDKDKEFVLWQVSNSSQTGKGKKEKQTKKYTLKQLLLSQDSGISSFGLEIIEHCLLSIALSSSLKVSDVVNESEVIQKLIDVFRDEGPRLLRDLSTSTHPGYIIYKPLNSSAIGNPSISTVAPLRLLVRLVISLYRPFRRPRQRIPRIRPETLQTTRTQAISRVCDI